MDKKQGLTTTTRTNDVVEVKLNYNIGALSQRTVYLVETNHGKDVVLSQEEYSPKKIVQMMLTDEAAGTTQYLWKFPKERISKILEDDELIIILLQDLLEVAGTTVISEEEFSKGIIVNAEEILDLLELLFEEIDMPHEKIVLELTAMSRQDLEWIMRKESKSVERFKKLISDGMSAEEF